jgi:hypothetical protein
MPESKDFGDYKFKGAAYYRIVVEGQLSPAWSDRLAGLSIERIEGNEQRPHTLLTGKIRDQAELNGVLESLYGLHLPIVRLEKLEQEEVNSL